MDIHWLGDASRFAILALGTALMSAPAMANPYATYGGECVTNYPSSGPCSAPALSNTCTEVEGFKSAMATLPSNWGWNFLFLEENSNAWSQDWIDNDVPWPGWGDGDWWSDGVTMAVFSGHGWINTSKGVAYWSFSNPIPADPIVSTSCDAAAGNTQAIIGEHAGDPYGAIPGHALFTALDACCVGDLTTVDSVWFGGGDGPGMMVHTNQGFAFMNTTDDNSSRLGNWVTSILDGYSNKDAWLDNGNWCFTFWCTSNSPIVYSKSDNQVDAESVAVNMNLDNYSLYPMPPYSGGYYEWYYIDNGRCP